MGPVNMKWYCERGLTRKVRKVLEEGRVFYPKGLGAGDVWEYDEITTHYSCGRIDIRDDSKEGYDGWDEYSLEPMHGEDWNDFSGWLDDFETHDLWALDDLIAEYENVSGKKIRWAVDDWDKVKKII
jgi:hypothetical protein